MRAPLQDLQPLVLEALQREAARQGPAELGDAAEVDLAHPLRRPRGEALRARDHEHVQAAVELLGLLPHRDGVLRHGRREASGLLRRPVALTGHI